MESCIVIMKHESPNFLENFLKTFSGILVCCYCLLSFQHDGFDQSRTSEKNGIHYFFNFWLCFHYCRHGFIFKDSYLVSWHIARSKNNMYISSSFKVLEIMWWPQSFSNLSVSLLILTWTSFWCSDYGEFNGKLFFFFFSCIIFNEWFCVWLEIQC